MKVILREDYPSLGYIGDVVAVRGGYARNFLLPRGIAVEAQSPKAKQLEHILSGINAKKAKKKAEAEAFAKRLEGIPLEFTLKLGEQGKSFGAVTVHDIELEFRKHDIQLDRKQIRLGEAIKSGGTFDVHVKLHSEVSTVVRVKVNVETPPPRQKDPEQQGRRERAQSRRRRAEDETAEGTGEEGSDSSEPASDADEA